MATFNSYVAIPKAMYQKLTEKADEHVSQVIDMLPCEDQKCAMKILNHLISTNRFKFHKESGCIFVDDQLLPGTNLVDILHFISKPSSDYANGSREIVVLLSESGFPVSALSDSRVKDLILSLRGL